ncbi:Tautomerase/MIF superfamily [Mycena galericulata]|nr:Tautomerase/MIF superfamily [Mycena galericulata]KAJ7494528.1 Tautomerase/MIF superfamily [Mycena galericulata]
MPYLELLVNVQIPNETEFVLAFSKAAAEALNKPEAVISVSVVYNKTLTFAGTLEPAFALSIISLDNLNPESNEKYSASLTEFFNSKLGIPNDRGYIAYLGFKGTTVAALWKKP